MVNRNESGWAGNRLINNHVGKIFKLNLGGSERLFVSTNDLVNELCDEKRFEKAVSGGLAQLRHLTHDGLFTAFTGEHNWEIAHRTLMPSFGPLPISQMFSDMHDIASQLVLKWARYGPDYKIPVTDDFTRLTLDSIALTAMGMRFNSFYSEEMHPFVNGMLDVLRESGERSSRPAFADRFMGSRKYKFDSDIAFLRGTAKDLLNQRRQHPNDNKDLLNAMIKGKDPKTGESLNEETVIGRSALSKGPKLTNHNLDNMITFLIAGMI